MGTDCWGQVDGGQVQGRARCHCTDCTAPAVLRMAQRLHSAAVAEALAVHPGKNRCTLSHGALMEGTLLLQDAYNPAVGTFQVADLGRNQ